ncbi:hypothetical protein DYBT9623_03953 [Dyadobacter sp. CECT 9623]|uniref:Glycosyltransferase 2-like domain-containing protein n=1 Tax=Dyadobacter linearis TaxID=2823330 RepID=A0ABM8UUH4_9BACT|nr:glycosyltransferase family 2 protein [Dyadobacter sp. CECT 9623]CAG5072014.1 hypothetical protein DYBT9623_03953 [Dyadobacter sp. CECT 9623]
MTKVYVVIVTYNGMAWIAKCLSNLDMSDVPYEAIIIDNNSNDGTYEFIEKNYNHTLIQSGENLGFAKANNIGIKLALQKNAELVFLLNQDCYLYPSSLRVLMEVSNKNKEYGILSPVHLNGVGSQLDFNFRDYMLRSKTLIDDYVLGRLSLIYPTQFVNAAAWMITGDCLRRVGGFDTMVFFHYGEDNNYCQRVLFHNFKIGIVPGAFAEHDRHLVVKPFNYKRELTRSKIPVFNINLSKSGAFRALLREEARLIRKMFRRLSKLELRLAVLNLRLMFELIIVFFGKISKDRYTNRNVPLAWLE